MFIQVRFDLKFRPKTLSNFNHICKKLIQAIEIIFLKKVSNFIFKKWKLSCNQFFLLGVIWSL